MRDQPPQDPQLVDLDKCVAQLKDYLATHPSTAPATPQKTSPQSSSATRFWVIGIWIGAIIIASIFMGPVLVALFPAGLLVFSGDAVNSQGLSNPLLPLCYFLYVILFLGVLLAPDRWLRNFIVMLVIVTLLNLGGCSVILHNLSGIH